jgi:hypothetical protein
VSMVLQVKPRRKTPKHSAPRAVHLSLEVLEAVFDMPICLAEKKLGKKRLRPLHVCETAHGLRECETAYCLQC